MENKHLIIGTAGHVDHGKTALVAALTGIECDTHKEEKQRGITINLGFAHFSLKSGEKVGIIDVPGHKDFIRTMVSGASGIDLGILVVAANSGVMPQTLEHIQIMEMLGVRAGIVVITKIDLVDKEMLELAIEEVKESISNSFLKDAEILQISSHTGEGIENLRNVISDTILSIPNRKSGEIFRMFIDRIFPIKGFGTVVTGSVLSGKISTGDKTFLLPGEKELKIRRIEQFGSEVNKVSAGDRASINLTGLSREDFKRGMLLSNKILKSTTMIDAKITLFNHTKKMDIWSRVEFHLGTYEAQVKVHLIDNNRITGGEQAIVQIHFPTPCIVQNGDRFILRASSGSITLGGGEIIDAFPLHHRRRPKPLIQNLKTIAEGKISELITLDIKKTQQAVFHTSIADRYNVSPKDIIYALEDNSNIIQVKTPKEISLIHKSTYDKWKGIVLRSITAFHKKNPMDSGGKTIDEVLGSVGVEKGSASDIVLVKIFEELEKENKIKKTGNSWSLFEHTANISAEMKQKIDFVTNYLKEDGMQTPVTSDLFMSAQNNGIKDSTLKQVLKFLVKSKKIYSIDGNYLYAGTVDSCRIKLLKALEHNKQGMTVAEFRDLVNGNRKICLLLLNIYDNEGVTERFDNYRKITDKGRDLLKQVSKG